MVRAAVQSALKMLTWKGLTLGHYGEEEYHRTSYNDSEKDVLDIHIEVMEYVEKREEV